MKFSRHILWVSVGFLGAATVAGCSGQSSEPPELTSMREVWDRSPEIRDAVCNANPDAWGLGRADYAVLSEKFDVATQGKFSGSDVEATSQWFLGSYTDPGWKLYLERGTYRTKFETALVDESIVDPATGEGKLVPLSETMATMAEQRPDFLGWIDPMAEPPCPWVPNPSAD